MMCVVFVFNSAKQCVWLVKESLIAFSALIFFSDILFMFLF